MRAKSEYPIRHADQHNPDGSDPLFGFIRYQTENIGDWLYIETTDDDTLTDGYGMKLNLSSGLEILAPAPNGSIVFNTGGQFQVTMLDWNMIGTGSQVIDFSGQAGFAANQQDYGGSWTVRADGLASMLDMDNSGDINITPANDFLANPVGGDVNLRIPTGKTFTVLSHTGFPQIQWTEGDIDVHIPSGGTIVADL